MSCIGGTHTWSGAGSGRRAGGGLRGGGGAEGGGLVRFGGAVAGHGAGGRVPFLDRGIGSWVRDRAREGSGAWCRGGGGGQDLGPGAGGGAWQGLGLGFWGGGGRGRARPGRDWPGAGSRGEGGLQVGTRACAWLGQGGPSGTLCNCIGNQNHIEHKGKAHV